MIRPNRWLIFIVACAGVVILALAGVLRPIKDAMRNALLPIIAFPAGAAQNLAAYLTPASDMRQASDRVKELEARISNLAVDYVQLSALKEENRSLRAQARFLATSGYDSVGARVISRDLQEDRAILLVDRGRRDHVEVGEAVITNEGIFVGKVSAISERVSTIELITDPRSRAAASFADEDTLVGVVEGRGNGAAVLTYIPSSMTVKRDQIIVTAGTEEKVPIHLPLGIVNAVEGKSTDPFFSAILEPLVSLDRVTFVSILRPTVLRPDS